MLNIIFLFDKDFANGNGEGYAIGVGKGNNGNSIHGMGGGFESGSRSRVKSSLYINKEID